MYEKIGEVQAKNSNSARLIAKQSFSKYVIDSVHLKQPKRKIKNKYTWNVSGHIRKKYLRENEKIKNAIKAWTAMGGPESQFYTMTSEKRKILEQFALEAPKYNRTSYRGVGFTEKEWNKIWEHWTIPGNIITNKALSSYTKDIHRAYIYGPGEVKVILHLDSASGVDISSYSLYPEEEEILLRKNIKLKVTEIGDEPGAVWHIHVKEEK